MNLLQIVSDMSEGDVTFVSLNGLIEQYIESAGIPTIPTRIEVDGYRILPGMAMARGVVKHVKTMSDEWGVRIRATSDDGIVVEWQILLSPTAVPVS